MALQTDITSADKEELPTISSNVETLNSCVQDTSIGTFAIKHETNGQRRNVSPRNLIREYFAKWFGKQPGLFPARPSFGIIVWTFIGTLLGIMAVAATGDYAESFFLKSGVQTPMPTAIGSFGALAVLVYGNVDSPLAQPRNVFFGNMISATIGASIAQGRIYLLKTYPPTDLDLDPQRYRWLAAGLSVACSHTAMQLTRTVHPPGGATALIAVLGSPAINELGFTYIIAPVLTGVLTMLGVALVVNNIQRRYPLYWWTPSSQPMAQSLVVENVGLSLADVEAPNYRSENIEKTPGTISRDYSGEHLCGATLREEIGFGDVMKPSHSVEGQEMEIYLREQLREATSRIELLERRLEEEQKLRPFEV